MNKYTRKPTCLTLSCLTIAVLWSMAQIALGYTKEYFTCGSALEITCTASDLKLTAEDIASGRYRVRLGEDILKPGTATDKPTHVTIADSQIKPAEGFYLTNEVNQTVRLDVQSVGSYTVEYGVNSFPYFYAGFFAFNKAGDTQAVFNSADSRIVFKPNVFATHFHFEPDSKTYTVEAATLIGAFSKDGNAYAEMKSGAIELGGKSGAVGAAVDTSKNATATAVMSGGTLTSLAKEYEPYTVGSAVRAQTFYQGGRHYAAEKNASVKSTVRLHAYAKMTGGRINLNTQHGGDNAFGYGTVAAINSWYGLAQSTVSLSENAFSLHRQNNIWDIDVYDRRGMYAGGHAHLETISYTNAMITLEHARIRTRVSGLKEGTSNVIAAISYGNDADNTVAGQVNIKVKHADLYTEHTHDSRSAPRAAILASTTNGGSNTVIIEEGSTIEALRTVALMVHASTNTNSAGAYYSFAPNKGTNHILIQGNSSLYGAYGIIARVNNSNDNTVVSEGKRVDHTNSITVRESSLISYLANASTEAPNPAMLTLGVYEGQTSRVDIQQSTIAGAHYLILDEDSLKDTEVTPLRPKDQSRAGTRYNLTKNNFADTSKHYGGGNSLINITDTVILDKVSVKDDQGQVSDIQAANKIQLGSGHDLLILDKLGAGSLSHIHVIDGGLHSGLQTGALDTDFDELKLENLGSSTQYEQFADEGEVKGWERISLSNTHLKLLKDLTISKGQSYHVGSNSVLYFDEYQAGGLSLDNRSVLNLVNPNGLSLDTDISNLGGRLILGDDQTQFATYTIKGNYSATDQASLVLHTQLAGDQSTTDKLVIEGTATASTMVEVKNSGGPGALTQIGIGIIEVKGGADEPADDAFKLSKPVQAGAYSYDLSRDGRTYYLKSKTDEKGVPIYSDEVAGYVLTPALANERLESFITQLASLGSDNSHARRRRRSVDEASGSWVASSASNQRIESQLGFMALDNSSIVNLGVNFISHKADTYHTQVGLAFGLGHSESELYNLQTSEQVLGRLKAKLYALGTYYAYQTTDKFYVNVGAGVHYLTQKYHLLKQSDDVIAQKGLGLSASTELGQLYGQQWFAKPHAQLVAQYTHYGQSKTENLAAAKAYQSLSFTTRLGVQLGYQSQSKLGAMTALSFRLSHRLNKPFNLNIANTEVRDHLPSTWYEAGVNIERPYKQAMIYGGLSYIGSFNQRKTGLSGELGLRYYW